VQYFCGITATENILSQNLFNCFLFFCISNG